MRIGAIALLLAAAPASAADEEGDPDNFFFHKAGVLKETALADWEECRELASAVEPPRGPSVYTPTVAGAAAAPWARPQLRRDPGGRLLELRPRRA